jgi:hypothetical protein
VAAAKEHQGRLNQRDALPQLPPLAPPSHESKLHDAREWAKANPDAWKVAELEVERLMDLTYPDRDRANLSEFQRYFREGVILTVVGWTQKRAP